MPAEECCQHCGSYEDDCGHTQCEGCGAFPGKCSCFLIRVVQTTPKDQMQAALYRYGQCMSHCHGFDHGDPDDCTCGYLLLQEALGDKYR